MQEFELTISQCEGTQHTPIDPSNIYPAYTTRGRSRRQFMLFPHDANKLIIAHPLGNSVLRVIIHDINYDIPAAYPKTNEVPGCRRPGPSRLQDIRLDKYIPSRGRVVIAKSDI